MLRRAYQSPRHVLMANCSRVLLSLKYEDSTAACGALSSILLLVIPSIPWYLVKLTPGSRHQMQSRLFAHHALPQLAYVIFCLCAILSLPGINSCSTLSERPNTFQVRGGVTSLHLIRHCTDIRCLISSSAQARK